MGLGELSGEESCCGLGQGGCGKAFLTGFAM